MVVADLVRVMETIAPLSFAESWDKVGLHVGRLRAPLRSPVLLTIDLNESVMAEAERANAGAIIAYHPPIWEPLKALTDRTPKERMLLRAAEMGMAVYSPHTALDAVPGGMTDWLCEGLSENGKVPGDCRALKSHAARPATAEVKVVTFVPLSDADNVRNALATAGAGIIGAYTVCSFASPGTGTFLGDESSRPSVGRRGVLDSVSELRLEMVCSKAALPLAVGLIGVCCGAGAEWAGVASSEGCELFITGEMRHHEITACLDRGLSILLGEHTSTERGYLPRLATRVESMLPGVACIVSKNDTDPLTAV